MTPKTFVHDNTEYLITALGVGFWKQPTTDPKRPYYYVEATLEAHRAHEEWLADLAELEDLWATQDDASYRGQ